MKIAMIGTRGVPARYGGFETAVEEIGAGLSELGHDVTIYCRFNNQAGDRHRGMRRVVLPSIHRKALETLSHGGVSALHAIVSERPDVAIVFNAANAPWVAMLRMCGIPTALHIDGHDAKRAKWRGLGAMYYRWAYRFGIRVANRVIVDSRAIRNDLGLDDDPKTNYIAYGARRTTDDDETIAKLLHDIGLEPKGYHLMVARFEPENHVLEIVQGYAASATKLPLVLVGFEGYPGDYTRDIVEAAAKDARIRMSGPVWDQRLLDAMYAGAASYVHGHSVGGTNPSLLRALVHGTTILAYDCSYNRETSQDVALWFKEPRTDLPRMFPRFERGGTACQTSAASADSPCTWAEISEAYNRLVAQLVRPSRALPDSPEDRLHDTARSTRSTTA
jgi:glycosyltransferase involved in cell wall biosynthesis